MGASRATRSFWLLIAGLVCLLAAGSTVLVNQGIAAWSAALGGIGLACLVAFAVLQPLPRAAGVLWRTGLAALLLIAAAAAVNLLSARFFVRLDLSELRGYSLAPETLEAISSLTEPVSITGFFGAGDYRTRLAEKLLGEYADRSPWIAFEVIDPELQPSAMKRKGVTRYGTLLFESGAKRQEIRSVDESSITGALLRLSSDRQPAVYFLTGNGERDVSSATREGYNVVKWRLENEGYRVETLDPATGAPMPSKEDVLVVASPRQAYSEERQAELSEFLLGGGKLIVLLDAGLSNPFPALLAGWGVSAPDCLVFDPVGNFFGDPATPLVSRFPPSPITRGLDGLHAFFPVAREVAALEDVPDGLSVTPLVFTSDASWGELDLTDPQAAFDPETDHRGPVALGVSVRGTLGAGRGAAAAGARLVVFGDSDFISNAALSSTDAAQGNASLFVNAIRWATEDEDLLRLPAGNTEPRRVVLTGREMRLVGYSSLLFVPLLAALAGAVAWWRDK